MTASRRYLVAALGVGLVCVGAWRWSSRRVPTAEASARGAREEGTAALGWLAPLLARAAVEQAAQPVIEAPPDLGRLAPKIRRVFEDPAPSSEAFFGALREEACACESRNCTIHLNARYARKADAYVMGDRDRTIALALQASECINAAWEADAPPIDEAAIALEREQASASIAANRKYGHMVTPDDAP